VVTEATWKGQKRLDIRTWVDIEGEFKPTKKGVAIPAEQVEEFLKAVARISLEL
jgi:uncharacterized protein (DUF488 family)